MLMLRGVPIALAKIRSSLRSKHTRRRGIWPVKPAMTRLMLSWLLRQTGWPSF